MSMGAVGTMSGNGVLHLMHHSGWPGSVAGAVRSKPSSASVSETSSAGGMAKAGSGGVCAMGAMAGHCILHLLHNSSIVGACHCNAMVMSMSNAQHILHLIGHALLLHDAQSGDGVAESDHLVPSWE
ncbi:hypothetical protein KC19_3G027400 [Ceratodon purpureus]|uniref:Uncharacterized protein n=1 Tax=Ceratodon purpureus TaxID=3225 RepID=A0A8T0IE52_CERPU|nr:hypothetical protein KC19_3G027400 [Ceratodon purpureus]